MAAEYRNGKLVVAAADVAASFVCHSWQQAVRQADKQEGGGRGEQALPGIDTLSDELWLMWLQCSAQRANLHNCTEVH